MQPNPNFYLFLDDVRHPDHVTWVKIPHNVEWTIVRNFNEFKDAVEKNGIPAFVSFDHDLGEDYGSCDMKTGMDCLKWLVTHVLLPDRRPMVPYALHTYSYSGRANMQSYIDSYNFSLE